MIIIIFRFRVKCHERCREMVAVDCLQKAAMKHVSKGDSTELKNIMLKLINERQKQHQPQLKLLEKIFNFQSESTDLIKSVKDSMG